MSKSHIDQLKKELTRAKWVIRTNISTFEFMDEWEISRPNGDTPLTITFTLGGNGAWGETIGNEDMGNAIGCHLRGYDGIGLYFGKYTGQFQKDIKTFIDALEAIEE